MFRLCNKQLTRQLTCIGPTVHNFSPTPHSSSTFRGLYVRQIRTVRSLFPILWSKIPEGFKNFYPKGHNDQKSDKRNEGQQEESSQAAKDPKQDPEQAPEQDPKQAPKQDPKQDNDEDQDQKHKPKHKKPDDGDLLFSFTSFDMWWMLAAIALLLVYKWTRSSTIEVTYQKFLAEILPTKTVTKLEVVVGPQTSKVDVYLNQSSKPEYAFTVGSIDTFERHFEDDQQQLGIDPKDFLQIQYVQEVGLSDMVSLLAVLTMGGLMVMTYRQMRGTPGGGGRNIFSIGKSNAVLIKPDEGKKITFSDVAGLDEAKVEIMEFVQFLKNPERFTRLGAKVPKGALLVGPPGTGKTLLAKAVAGEADVPFYSISGSDFIEMFVGVGASRVRDLFETARKDIPCIIFIDEIDAVGRARGRGSGGGNDERENTLNQLLVEMDGFATAEGVVVLAGTNRVDILDKALLRPGRFDRQIAIGNPDIRGRTQILKVHLKPLHHNLDVEELCKRLAALTPGMSGADLANVCNEAALIAARTNKDTVELVDFEAAIDRIIGGLAKKHSALTQNEKKIVSYHEAGHAVVGWFLEHADPLLKVTIVPRSNGALGFAQYLPKELALYQKEQLADMMAMALGGRAAEFVFFGKVSTGAVDDLRKVNRIAASSISIYGLSERLGNLSFQPEDGDQGFTKPYSEQTAEIIDEEVEKLIQVTYDRAVALVQEKRHLVEALALQLLEKETINHDVLVAILGPRPFVSDSYRQFMEMKDSDLRDTKTDLASHQKESETAWAEKDKEKDDGNQNGK